MQDFPTEAMEVMEDIDQQGYMINIIFNWKSLRQQQLYEYTSNLQDILRVIEELKKKKEEENRGRYPVYRRNLSFFVESSFRLVSVSKANKIAPLVDHSTYGVGFTRNNSETDNKIDGVLTPYIGGFSTSHFPLELVIEKTIPEWFTRSYKDRLEWLNRDYIVDACPFYGCYGRAGVNCFYRFKTKENKIVFFLFNRRSSKFGWWLKGEADPYTLNPPRLFDTEEKMLDDAAVSVNGLYTLEQLRNRRWQQQVPLL